MTDLFGQPLIRANDIQEQAEVVYQAYPLKVGRPVAIRSIIKAIKTSTFRYVLERTKMFAAAREGDKSFIPHPSTWFNQQRYNDDPETWVRQDAVGIKTKLTAVEFVIDSHIANAGSSNYSPKCSAAEQEELHNLKKKRLALIRKIATS